MNPKLIITIISILFFGISNSQSKSNFLIDDILDYETLVKLIVNENKFEDYKIYENIMNNSLLEDFLVFYKKEKNNLNYFNDICKNLETSINLLIPRFLKEC